MNPDCSTDPIACLVNLWMQMEQARVSQGQCPVSRTTFAKPNGMVRGALRMLPNLPAALQVGLFSGAEYPAWVRFSGDTESTMSDYHAVQGVGIKLFDVPGKKLVGQPDANTFDIVMQNSEVFFVNNAAQMCEFTQSILSGQMQQFLEANPASAQIMQQMMSKSVASCLAISYWGGSAFAFGPEQYVKYKLEPYLDLPPLTGVPEDPTYLAKDLQARLLAGEVKFKFLVQFRTHPETMSLDAAMEPWSEIASPLVHIADLVLFQQDVTARAQADYGENLSYNIWRVTAEHAPQGSLSLARREVYETSAKLRRDMNGIPTGEPDQPKPWQQKAPVVDRVIVRASIHPGIGIARVGDSVDEYFIGPQTTTPQQQPATYYRDANFALKRQAAEFRIYGYNAAGELVRELTADSADIQWTAHLANKKGSWYQFITPMDIPQAIKVQAQPRNATVDDRSTLEIDPGPRTIGGKSRSGPEYAFDTGKFLGEVVPLGELRTDASGRLLVLGGHGVSGSPTNAPIYNPEEPESFPNSDGWYDDISDGPVTAQVTISGREIPVEPAWVVVAPVNYAPDMVSWRTAWDLMTDAYTEAGWLGAPQQVSFTQDVLPLLLRLSNLQWVNRGFAAMFGSGAPMDFNDPDFLAKLSAPPDPETHVDPWMALRCTITNCFRLDLKKINQPKAWPWIFGNAYEAATSRHPGLNYFPVSSIGLSTRGRFILEKWMEGHFIADWPPAAPPPATIDKVPLKDQPAMLDRAALQYCLADAFLPGIEMPWIIGSFMLYSSPYRFRQKAPGAVEAPALTLNIRTAYGLEGPIRLGQGPGDITRWMGVPWQADTAMCRSGYNPKYDPYVPAFWPARVPNQVLTQADYEKVIDTTLPMETRVAAFQYRASWFRALTFDPSLPVDPTSQEMLQMVKEFAAMGLVTPMPGVAGEGVFPETLYVESVAVPAETNPLKSHLEHAGWMDDEHLTRHREVHTLHLGL